AAVTVSGRSTPSVNLHLTGSRPHARTFKIVEAAIINTSLTPTNSQLNKAKSNKRCDESLSCLVAMFGRSNQVRNHLVTATASQFIPTARILDFSRKAAAP